MSSYANVTQKQSFPTTDQVIAMDSTESVSLKDYILAIGKLVKSINIRFTSKMLMN